MGHEKNLLRDIVNGNFHIFEFQFADHLTDHIKSVADNAIELPLILLNLRWSIDHQKFWYLLDEAQLLTGFLVIVLFHNLCILEISGLGKVQSNNGMLE